MIQPHMMSECAKPRSGSRFQMTRFRAKSLVTRSIHEQKFAFHAVIEPGHAKTIHRHRYVHEKTKYFITRLWSLYKRLILVLLGHEVSPLQRGLVVVSALVFALEQFHFVPLYLLVGNELQEMRDAVKARPLLVV